MGAEKRQLRIVSPDEAEVARETAVGFLARKHGCGPPPTAPDGAEGLGGVGGGARSIRSLTKNNQPTNNQPTTQPTNQLTGNFLLKEAKAVKERVADGSIYSWIYLWAAIAAASEWLSHEELEELACEHKGDFNIALKRLLASRGHWPGFRAIKSEIICRVGIWRETWE